MNRKKKKYHHDMAAASEFIDRIWDYRKKHPTAEAILYIRVSGKEQVYKRNHLNHLKTLRKFCKRHGIPIIDLFSNNISGKKVNCDRKEFIDAIKAARKYRRHGIDVFLFTTTADRFLRNEHYSPKTNWKALPTRPEWESLMELARDIPLVTLKPPDMSPKKVRGYHSKLGQRYKNNKGGRPKGSKDRKPRKKKTSPKRQRLEKVDTVFSMRKDGASWGLIEKVTDVKKGTAQYWWKLGYKHWHDKDS